MKKILIVEDQPDIRKLIRMTLEFEDYEIHEAADGAFGLRMAAALGPDLVLLDVMMPDELDGLQVWTPVDPILPLGQVRACSKASTAPTRRATSRVPAWACAWCRRSCSCRAARSRSTASPASAPA